MAGRETPGAAAGVLGPGAATCEVLTFRAGALSAVGHDLLLRVTAFELAIDAAGVAVSARLDPASLRVEGALRGGRLAPGALSPADVREIEASIASTVLRPARFPEIRFASTEVRRRPDGFAVRGALTLAGVTRPLELAARRAAGRLVAEVTLSQPDFGIRPFSAMLGALRVRPDVLVRVSVPDAWP